MDDECEHLYIRDGCCELCGIELDPRQEVAESPDANGQRANPYSRDLAILDVPLEVKSWIMQVSQDTQCPSSRKSSHRKNLFVYLYIAYNNFGLLFDAEGIGRQLELEPEDQRLSYRIASGMQRSEHQVAVQMPVCIIYASRHIDKQASHVVTLYEFRPDQLFRMREFSDRLSRCYEALYDENPIALAAAILRVFFDLNKLNARGFEKLVRLTPNYLKGIVQKVYEAIPHITFEDCVA